jgi:hypothetical protein
MKIKNLFLEYLYSIFITVNPDNSRPIKNKTSVAAIKKRWTPIRRGLEPRSQKKNPAACFIEISSNLIQCGGGYPPRFQHGLWSGAVLPSYNTERPDG